MSFRRPAARSGCVLAFRLRVDLATRRRLLRTFFGTFLLERGLGFRLVLR